MMGRVCYEREARNPSVLPSDDAAMLVAAQERVRFGGAADKIDQPDDER